MGYFTLGVLGFSAIQVVFSTLLGLIRGRNRSILRLFLIIGSAVGAYFLIGALVPVIMNINVGEAGTMKEMLSEAFTGEVAIPEKLQAIIFTLVEVVLGIAVYILVFFVLKFLSWIILYPIFKIFIKKGAKKRVGFGALVGLLQGIVVAFLICAPVTGLVGEVQAISKIEMNGNQMLPIPEEVGIDDYANSPFFKIFSVTGNWYYELVSSKKTEDGTNVSLSDTIDVVVATTEIANKAQDLSSGIENVSKENATPQDRVDGLNKIGDSLIGIDESINNLGDDGKELLKELITTVVEMAGGSSEGEGEGEGETLPPEVTEFIENIDLDDLSLKATGEALQGVATYIEKTTTGFENYGEEVTQEEVTTIINGIGENSFILDMLGADSEDIPTLIPVESENQQKFESAISSNTKLSEEDKDLLRKLFGLN